MWAISTRAFRRGIEAAIEARLPVRLNLVVTNESAEEVRQMVDMAESWGLEHNVYTNMTPTIYGGAESLLAQSAAHLKARKRFTGCNAGHTFFHADPHGKVSICKVGRDDQIDLMAEGFEGLRRLGAVPEAVRPLDEWPATAQATFPRFAELLADEGFAFLHSRMEAGGVGPVLVAVDGRRVVGAIGPMEVMPDPRGAARLLPQYFGVLPEQRGRGLGRALWRAAMHWGQENGAVYQLLQTEIGGASDRLCQAEGLRSLGFVCVAKV